MSLCLHIYSIILRAEEKYPYNFQFLIHQFYEFKNMIFSEKNIKFKQKWKAKRSNMY